MRLGICCALVAAFLQSGAPAAASPESAPLYTSPGPGARYVLPQTTILVRSSGPLRLGPTDPQALFTVAGSRSGRHAGQVLLSDDGRALIFRPFTLFTPGETVSVTLAPGLRTDRGQSLPAESYKFEIAKLESVIRLDSPISLLAETGLVDPAPQPPREWSRRWVPEAFAASETLPPDFPSYSSLRTNSAARGLTFVTNLKLFPGDAPPYLLILYNDGSPYFYRRMAANCYDFKPQPNGLLTYYDNSPKSKFYALDSTFTVVDSFQCGNGYGADLHELRVLPNGHALLMSYFVVTTDMRQYVAGGDSAAQVAHLVIQELDTQKNVVFQWASWDHFQILDAHGVDFTGHVIDYVHGNALDLDTDGNILLSSRHLDEITKINRNTGDIVWRLGGNHNQFTFVNDTIGFSHQHAIRRIANGDITLFDNGNMRVPPFSRAVEYRLDETHMTATLVWQYRPVPDNYAYAMGYVERLANGNTLIGWGATNPSVTEVTPGGSLAYQLDLAHNTFSYRAFREVWPPGEVVSAQAAPEPHTQLYPIAPNPVRSHATIGMAMERTGPARLAVYDVSGRRVQTILAGGILPAGVHRFDFDGSKLATGVYFCRLAADGVTSVRRMVVLR